MKNLRLSLQAIIMNVLIPSLQASMEDRCPPQRNTSIPIDIEIKNVIISVLDWTWTDMVIYLRSLLKCILIIFSDQFSNLTENWPEFDIYDALFFENESTKRNWQLQLCKKEWIELTAFKNGMLNIATNCLTTRKKLHL